MIDAVIFDLNGVFINSPPLSKRFEKDFGVSADEFLLVLNSAMDVVRKPTTVDTYSIFAPHLKRWEVNLGREAFYHYWFSAEKPDTIMLTVARELKSSGIKIFALSNNFRERIEYYHTQFPFMADLFDEIRYSCLTGFVKPNPQCWSSIIEKHSLNTVNVIYFDDSDKNIDVAKSLGINAYKFVDARQVRELCCLN